MAHNLLITDGIEPTPRRFDLPRQNGQPTTAEMVAYPVHAVPLDYDPGPFVGLPDTLVEVPIAGFVRGRSEGRKSGLAECWWLAKVLHYYTHKPTNANAKWNPTWRNSGWGGSNALAETKAGAILQIKSVLSYGGNTVKLFFFLEKITHPSFSEKK
ncbi:hypothetical protein DFH06DRAFT_1130729 [Mycena polygramma]|nr:hypothetical protein DFH06DRAFT_1130729 [Mycena polygramma]